MKSGNIYLIFILFTGGLFGPPKPTVSAKQAFEGGQYVQSIADFGKALKVRGDASDAIFFNIGQCWYKLDSTGRAFGEYGKISNSNLQLSSMADNNSGVILGNDPQKIDQAIETLKKALREDPENDLARYNYEVLKRRKEQNKQNQNQDQNQDQDQNKEDQQDNKQNQDNQQNDQKRNTPKQRQGTEGQEPQPQQEISMEQAKMLLEGMKENEKRFLQQLRKSAKTRPSPDGTPDW